MADWGYTPNISNSNLIWPTFTNEFHFNATPLINNPNNNLLFGNNIISNWNTYGGFYYHPPGDINNGNPFLNFTSSFSRGFSNITSGFDEWFSNFCGRTRHTSRRFGRWVTSSIEDAGCKVKNIAAELGKSEKARIKMYAPIIEEAARKYKIDANILYSIIRQESGFKANASSGKACGLMQLAPDTARALKVKNIWDPRQNIMGGARYISELLDRYHGDRKLAFAAYNSGPGTVDKLVRRHGKSYEAICQYLPKETILYVPKVQGNILVFNRWNGLHSKTEIA